MQEENGNPRQQHTEASAGTVQQHDIFAGFDNLSNFGQRSTLAHCHQSMVRPDLLGLQRLAGTTSTGGRQPACSAIKLVV